jgi:hypothetical protein
MGLQHHHRRGIKSAATLLVCRPTPHRIVATAPAHVRIGAEDRMRAVAPGQRSGGSWMRKSGSA